VKRQVIPILPPEQRWPEGTRTELNAWSKEKKIAHIYDLIILGYEDDARDKFPKLYNDIMKNITIINITRNNQQPPRHTPLNDR
jgi:hypothetical protein